MVPFGSPSTRGSETHLSSRLVWFKVEPASGTLSSEDVDEAADIIFESRRKPDSQIVRVPGFRNFGDHKKGVRQETACQRHWYWQPVLYRSELISEC
jgi:hypothetical protein